MSQSETLQVKIAEAADTFMCSSIYLEGYESPIPGPSIANRLKPRKGETILLKAEDFCPSIENGKTTYGALSELLKKLANVGVIAAAVICGVRTGASAAAAAAKVCLPEGDSTLAVPEDGVGTFKPLSMSTRNVRFDEALFGLDSMSRSLYVKAVIDPEGEESVDDVIRRVEELGLLLFENGDVDGDRDGDGGIHKYDGVDGEGEGEGDLQCGRSGFILINVHGTDLGGDGQAFIHMEEELDENDQGDIDVCFSGSRF